MTCEKPERGAFCSQEIVQLQFCSMESSEVLLQMFVISPYQDQKQSEALIKVLFAILLSPVCFLAS